MMSNKEDKEEEILLITQMMNKLKSFFRRSHC